MELHQSPAAERRCNLFHSGTFESCFFALVCCTAETLRQVLLLGLQILARKYSPISFVGALHCGKGNSLCCSGKMSKISQSSSKIIDV